ncbi:hypothetical protein L1049_001076 [Liquidambar formosana]|uniref:Glycosyltransferase 61 catalytic domain-containing protein n=1 Tax=Liquidambar formosana TaxID=63359 RepID=A0AAP0NAA0_LIQFO
MSMRKSSLLKILLSLFALNSVSLYLYFSSHPDHNFLHKPQSENRKTLPENHQISQFSVPTSHPKPWPILPSYLPWDQNRNVPFRSCEAYFGNGFNRRFDLLGSAAAFGGSRAASGGWFRCFYSETLRSSICEGGRVRMSPEKIRMSKGGESLDEVIGRGEDEELPAFEAGAFDIDGGGGKEVGKKLVSGESLDEFVPQGAVARHTMRSLIDSMRVVGEKDFECEQWVEEPTLLVTRFEYANLFHTVTDWYSAYVASRVTGLPNRPQLVFVDGHCKAPLEETWKALFSSLRYAKNFSGPVCFRHAVLSPLGYETALFKGLTEDINCHGASAHDLWQNPDDKKTARLSEFGEMIRAAFGFPVDYLAHPRHRGKVESRLSNEQEVFDSLKSWAANHLECKVNLVNGLFAHMPMKEQVRSIQDASVIIGAHGAGLTHIVSATSKTVVLEIISSEYRRPHFALISQWKGLEYHAINLPGSYADPAVVIDRLGRIMRSLGC